MTLIDLLINSVMISMLGLLLEVIPAQSESYFRIAAGLYLVKTVIWLALRVPLLLPIDRWEKNGSPPEDNAPALIRGIYYFPFDFTLFYGLLLGAFYAVLMAWMVYGPGPIQIGPDLMFAGLMFAGSVCAGAIAIGVPVNLILTARLSRRLSERKALHFDDIPGKELSLRTKMATIALALGCAPTLLLFSFQTFVQDRGLYREAERTSQAIMRGLASEQPGGFERWALAEGVHPFWIEGGKIRFVGEGAPPQDAEKLVLALASEHRKVARLERKLRLVVRLQPRRGGIHGVVVRVPDPENHLLALSFVVVLACIWPLLTATLLVRTIVLPISLIGSTFHGIIGRGRTQETDRVPVFYKDEVGRLAFNANRTIDILTEARNELEVTAQRLALKNQELQEAYRTKGEFLANMSHELRTPLNAIIGFSRLMKRKLGDALPERQRKNLGLIEQSGEQLLALVNELLDFEKIEAGKLDIRRQDVELAPFLEALSQSLSPVAQEKGLTLEFAATRLPKVIRSDKDRLRQILINLITNAVKYSDRGTVTVRTEADSKSIVFAVSDQGIGMTSEQMSGIFDPFHQVDASETRERGGVGLGLAIVARLVKLLGGEIAVSSVKNQGSTFTVSLPLDDTLSRLIPQGNGEEVLVVDDNPDDLEAIYNELNSADFRVTVASSGEQALQLLRTSYRPNVILLDIVMPEMDGWEVLRQLRAIPDLAEVPVVIISVVNDRPVGLDVDFAGWLSKPLEFEQLTRYLLGAGPTGVAQRLAGGLVIVEDDPRTAALLEQVFEDSGVTPLIFSGESQAKEFLAQGPLPSVLILDLNLEEGSGWSLLSYFRNLPQSEKTRVFVYTASDLSAREKALLNEAIVTVVKKHGRDSLSHLVNSIVRTTAPKS